MVLLEGHEVVVVDVVVDLEGAAAGVEGVVRRYLQKTLMLI